MPIRPSTGERLLERFWSKVDKTETCWLWTAAVTNNGYGRIKVCGVMHMAHRLAYELEIGPISDGLTLDHLCRNTYCVKPAHLEAVTMRVNVLRGETITAANANKTACDAGHPLEGRNLFIRRDGRRLCRTCKNAAASRLRRSDTYRLRHAQEERERRARKGVQP